jgi:hypothetical protein
MQDNLVACVNINGLMEALDIDYNSEEWRRFTGFSSVSLKAVLLHDGNELPSIPIGCAVHTKGSDEDMNILLETIKYRAFQWQICRDLKVNAPY